MLVSLVRDGRLTYGSGGVRKMRGWGERSSTSWYVCMGVRKVSREVLGRAGGRDRMVCRGQLFFGRRAVRG